MVKILRKSAIFRRYCIQNVKDGIHSNIGNESAKHFSQFISVEDKKNSSKYQAQFWEKLRELRLR